MTDFIAVDNHKINDVQKKGSAMKEKRGRKPGIKPNEQKELNPFKQTKEISEDKGIKKGKKAQFRPASKLGYFNAPDGYVGRWVNAGDQGNMMRKQAEGWEVVNMATMPGFQHINEIIRHKEVTESGGLGNGVLRHNEMIAMILPNEMKESRDQYYGNLTKKRTEARIQSKEQKEKLQASGYDNAIHSNTLTID